MCDKQDQTKANINYKIKGKIDQPKNNILCQLGQHRIEKDQKGSKPTKKDQKGPKKTKKQPEEKKIIRQNKWDQ